MKLAVAQINCTVGDLVGNSARIVASANSAKAAGATLMLTPELALSGYPPEDLLLREDFHQACERALHELAGLVTGLTVIVGHPLRYQDVCYNAASVLRDGQVVATYRKHALPGSKKRT